MLRSRISRLSQKFERPYAVYNRIEVSRSALLNNLNFFRETHKQEVIPVLKGNAYGHGIEQVATALKGAQIPYIAVDSYFEAIRVRSYNAMPVLVMGMIKPNNFAHLRLKGLTFVVQDRATIVALGALGKRIKVHLEINTGMNRNGIHPGKLGDYLQLLKTFPKLHLEGVMTHLADADGSDHSTVANAVTLFDTSIDLILTEGFMPKYFHIGQSAGSFVVKSRYANVVRAGIGFYGINPFSQGHALHKRCKQLRPALKLISTISRINQLKTGDKVSYNYTFTASKPLKIGVLPLGYYEGVDRVLSNKGSVKSTEGYLPIVGRVCMNHTMISLDDTGLKVGDEVVVYSDIPSDKNSIESISRHYGLFTYSQLTHFSSDVRRYLVD